ncbi:hypothetical protein FDC64_11360 [Clostridium botulinum]|uniref:hypothetical protein n=1 Tax=Clostridium botulinum TaxID=1491 RepID=UPI0004D00DB7|nr:hypothetical protein [Clostridium botulinum]MBY6773679.1 hypothetical protein [Clostridium botulinum]MBY6864279.1 hypothetical protein [Clostridium botulinum]MBY6984842.1 hypothetical protein [Clostridium botulinum]NFP26155.1 hypothetical protein [Clostridium botulinum]
MKYKEIEEKIIIPNEMEENYRISKSQRELENFKEGLKIFTDKCKYLNKQSLESLLLLYGNIAILMDKSIKEYSKEIAYPCQELQDYIYKEINKRINEY